MKAAEAVIRCLLEENIKTIFGYPGASVIPLYEALRTSDIHHILVRQEQAAAHSASGYARATRTTGVCIGTSGPGATNLITGIATAYMDSIPLVIITGQVKSTLIGRDVFQEVDITGATEPFTKHSYLVKEAKQIPRIMKEAFHIAATGRPGPVLIDIPLDIQNEDIDFHYPQKVDIRGYKPTYKGHIGQIKRILKKLETSHKPLICVGGGIISAGAVEELKSFAEKSKIPVVYTLMGVGALATDNPYYFGMVGSHGHYCANKAVAGADLLVVIGARIGDRATHGCQVFAKNADVIHIDIDPAEIDKNLGVLIPVVGDAKNILEQLLEGVKPLRTDEWIEELCTWKENEQASESPNQEAVDPKYAMQLLGRMARDDVIVTADVGQNQIWAVRNFPMKSNRKFFTSGGLGTMGYSLPAAIGAKIGAPDRPVIAVMGDGGFQMSLFELATINQCHVNIIILLFNNERLGMVGEIQDNVYGYSFGVDMDGNPDFIKLAEAYGLKGRRVASNDELEDAFNEALNLQQTVLLECMVDLQESTF